MPAALLDAVRVVNDDALAGAAAAAHEGENCDGEVDALPRLRRLRREPRLRPRSKAGLIHGRRRGYVVAETTNLKMRLAASNRTTRARARLAANTVTQYLLWKYIFISVKGLALSCNGIWSWLDSCRHW